MGLLVMLTQVNTGQTIVLPYMSSGPQIQQAIQEDDLPLPTFDSRNTMLTNFGGVTRTITLQMTLNDSSTDVAYNPITGVHTNGTGNFYATLDGGGQVVSCSGQVFLVYPDQVQYLESVFTSADFSVVYEIQMVDSQSYQVYETYWGLITELTLAPQPGTRIVDLTVQFEQGNNIASTQQSFLATS